MFCSTKYLINDAVLKQVFDFYQALELLIAMSSRNRFFSFFVGSR